MKKAVQFGAGNIGRGFIGALLSQSGYHVVFADVVDKIIDKINEDKTYTVHVMDVECEDQKIENISGVNSYRSYNRSSYRKTYGRRKQRADEHHRM